MELDIAPSSTLYSSPMTPHLPADQLRNPAIMLETLKVAYREALDRISAEGSKRIGEDRLSVEEQCELGRRLALYWSMDVESSPASKPRKPTRVDKLVDRLRNDLRAKRATP